MKDMFLKILREKLITKLDNPHWDIEDYYMYDYFSINEIKRIMKNYNITLDKNFLPILIERVRQNNKILQNTFYNKKNKSYYFNTDIVCIEEIQNVLKNI